MRFYIFLTQFSSAFAFHQAMPIYLPYLVLIGFFKVVFGGVKFKFSRLDYLPFMVFFLAIFSFFLNNLFYGWGFSGIGHVVAYFFAFIVFYYFVRNLIESECIDILILLKWIFIAVIFTSFFLIIEFILKSILLLPFDDFIYRPAVKIMDAIDSGYFRARGFTEEPGHTAMFLEVFFPLAMFYVLYKKNYYLIFLFFVLVFLAFLVTFSTSAFFIIPFSFILVLILKIIYEKKIKKIYIFYLFKYIAYGLLFFFILFFILDLVGILSFLDLINSVFSKINSSSSSDRLDRLQQFYSVFSNANIINMFFGYGPGAYKELGINSIVSLYPTLLIEIGIVGILVFLVFIASLIHNSLKIKGILGFLVAYSLMSGVLHFMFISNYWYPWFWLSCALSVLIVKKSIQIKSNLR